MDKRNNKIKELFTKTKRKSFWITAASLLAFAAVFTTVHFLILPAATMEKQPICGIEEHQHTDSCYKEEKVLVCTIPESDSHKHTDECYTVERTLICEKKEHVHTAECFKQSDLKADKESEEDWKRSVAPAKLNGKWAHDILEVAKTQIDYSESEDNFVYSTDGDKKGYTRYGDWFGNKYADWNTMFVSFCLNYANIPQDCIPYKTSADIKDWVTALKQKGLYKTPEKEIPKSGDLLFLDNNKDGKADDVAIIDEVKSDEAGKGKVTAIKGNSKDKVEAKSYSLKDKEVIGFGRLLEKRGRANFAVNKAQYGTYWKTIRNTNELQHGQTYVIMAADGTYVASNGNSCQQVNLEPVKGNPDYYVINNIPGSALLTYENGNIFRNGNNYIDPRNEGGCFSGSRNSLKVERSNTPACFWISQEKQVGFFSKQRNYLNMDPERLSKPVLKGSPTKRLYEKRTYEPYPGSGGGKNTLHKFNQTADMMILKRVNTTLQIPDSPPDPYGGIGGTTPVASKPKYDGYLTVSDRKTGTYEDPRGTVNYYSDPSTSQIENEFGNNPLQGKSDYNAQKVDDGKTLTDKSVVYRHDDYNAIDTYEDGTFGVTLSALGQTFAKQVQTTVPLDVIFILDLSVSMNEKEPGQDKARALLMAESLNNSIKKLMQLNPENRFAAVGFHSKGYDFYPMGHHAPGAGNMYFQYANKKMTALGPTSYRNTVDVGTGGTFTQLGIAQAHQMMMRVGDTKYKVVENGQTIYKPRKPIIILMSDGGPSHCTCFYTDVLHNPYYGDAHGEDYNCKGVLGYYTILSANYYKEMVGVHYDCKASMYTVAGAIREWATNSAPQENMSLHYRATVLNPTSRNIEYLNTISSAPHKEAIVERQLYNLLKGRHNTPIDIGGFMDLNNTLGHPHRFVGIVKNHPYKSNYSYADKAYFNNSAANGIEVAIDDIMNIHKIPIYTYETLANTSIDVSDPIGADMEIKGAPVLRVNGKNFTHKEIVKVSDKVTQYKYEGIVPMGQYNTTNTIDLSTITVTVETNKKGLQEVKMSIPPRSLPVYTPDQTLSFYYESLPIRLIYKVGMSQSAQEKIDSLASGETITFYTNRYDTENHANGCLQPSPINPFYKNNKLWVEHVNKKDNTTATDDYSRDINGKTNVLQSLGNNGKLVITKKSEAVKKEINVEKRWLDYESKPTTEKIPEKITATLYRTYNDENGKSVREDVLEFTLEAANGWKKTFTAKDLNETPGREYQYYVNEEKIEGYKVKYEGDGVNENTAETPIVITNKYIYSDFVLPSTGGPGTIILTSVGVILMTAALVYGYVLFSKKRKDESK